MSTDTSMTTGMTGARGPMRRPWRSVWALLAGFLLVVILSLATDLILHAAGVFPPLGQRMSDGLFVLATVYRIIYSVLGSYVTARAAPYRPMLHALAGGVVGLVIGTVGAAATWNRGPALGPHWYPLALILIALPCAWVGGRLREWQESRAE